MTLRNSAAPLGAVMTIGARVNAERLAHELGIPMDGVARILGTSERFPRRYPEGS
jgi:hypothetical protein